MVKRRRTFTRKVTLQKGGFSYMVMEGVRGAALLLPLAVRQGITLLRSGDNKRRRTAKQKKSRKSRK